ncbi:hypothetical protein P1X14_10335 [Sphingomonas sp. AOB5]|uniref:hypothetical protein n=1 Tax=Sphingomonas sp. AOB5 TaxID=3034017 RepID=UPI0023F6C58C|nr:hypothetical protein [Sphingomonas sp. AOB5]MDF7775645.1 hypothetical protein [Sphingomonas sp. AOB5]
MRKIAIAAVVLLASAAPALAEWAPSKWGMSPEQVIKAVPNAVAVVRDGDGKDVSGHHQLATAPTKDGAIQLQANFYFEPGKRQLAFIQFVPGTAQCKDYQTLLESRNGAGKHDDKDLDKIQLTVIEWVEAGSKDKLKYVGVTASANGAWLYCHLHREKP